MHLSKAQITGKQCAAEGFNDVEPSKGEPPTMGSVPTFYSTFGNRV